MTQIMALFHFFLAFLLTIKKPQFIKKTPNIFGFGSTNANLATMGAGEEDIDRGRRGRDFFRKKERGKGKEVERTRKGPFH